jgi:hypothetical protein
MTQDVRVIRQPRSGMLGIPLIVLVGFVVAVATSGVFVRWGWWLAIGAGFVAAAPFVLLALSFAWRLARDPGFVFSATSVRIPPFGLLRHRATHIRYEDITDIVAMHMRRVRILHSGGQTLVDLSYPGSDDILPELARRRLASLLDSGDTDDALDALWQGFPDLALQVEEAGPHEALRLLREQEARSADAIGPQAPLSRALRLAIAQMAEEAD